MVQIKVNKSVKNENDVMLEEAIKGFLGVKMEMDTLGDKLNAYKEIIATKAKEELKESDNATCTFGVDAGNVKVSFGWDIKVADEPKLRIILGERFDDLVKSSTTFTPVSKLKEMALDDDGLKSCLSIKEKSPSLAVVK